MPESTNDAVAAAFGTYVLPGRVADPRRGIEETAEAERLGMGTAWLSERFGLKDAPALCGAMAQATSRIRIGGTSYFLNRNPLTLASFMSTMQAISLGRFSLILARGVDDLMIRWGMPKSTYTLMADIAQILRKLLRGERVRYKGPAGDYPDLQLVDRYEGAPPPMVLTAIGPRTLAFAAAHFDGVLLHPMLTTEAVSRAAAIVRKAASEAGRAPGSVRVYANVIAAPDLDPAEEEAVVGGRAVTYLHNSWLGNILAGLNGWDASILDRLRAHPTFNRLGGEHADQAFTRAQLVEASRTLPREWLMKGAAVGSAAQCAERLKAYLDAGADEIVLHGSAPRQMENTMREIRTRMKGAS